MTKTIISLLITAFMVIGCLDPGPPSVDLSDSSPGAAGSLEGSPDRYILPGGQARTLDLRADAGLADMLRHAAMNNPGLQAAFNRWRAAIERVPQAKALPDPRFTYRYFIEEVETRVGAQRQSFGIAQMFPWWGKLALRGDAAAKAAQAEHQRYQAAKLKLFYRVTETYSEYYFLARAVAITEANVKLLKHIEAIARTRYKVAVATHRDVIRAQVELGKLGDRLVSLRELRGPVVAKLNAALNRAPSAELDWPKQLPQGRATFTDEQLFDRLAKSNPDLKALDFVIAKERTRIGLARKNYFPDVTIGLNYVDTANSTSGRNPRDDGKDPVVAMISINLPIWWDKLAAGVREARHRHIAAVGQRADKVNSLSSQLKMVLYRFRDAERKAALYRDTLTPKARESLKVTEASFTAGKAGFIDLVDAQRILLEFELATERALANRAQRLAELEMLIGQELRGAAGARPSKP